MVQVLIIRSHSLVGTFIRSRDDKLYVELKERKNKRKIKNIYYKLPTRKQEKKQGPREVQKLKRKFHQFTEKSD